MLWEIEKRVEDGYDAVQACVLARKCDVVEYVVKGVRFCGEVTIAGIWRGW